MSPPPVDCYNTDRLNWNVGIFAAKLHARGQTKTFSNCVKRLHLAETVGNPRFNRSYYRTRFVGELAPDTISDIGSRCNSTSISFDIQQMRGHRAVAKFPVRVSRKFECGHFLNSAK
jgi:hypothetical protein